MFLYPCGVGTNRKKVYLCARYVSARQFLIILNKNRWLIIVFVFLSCKSSVKDKLTEN